MGKIKVCHMTSVHGKEDIRIFHKECVSLAQAGYEVYLVERGESYDKNGVHIVGVGDIPDSRLKRMTEGSKRVYEAALALDCEIYHLHDPELLPYGLKLKRKGKKVVFDSHELTRKQIKERPYLPKPLLSVISFFYSLYEDFVLSRIDGVIFPCLVDGKFPLRGRRTVLLNNVPRLDELYDKYDPDAEKTPDSICMVGSLFYERGITHFVKAVHQAGGQAYLGGKFSPASYEEELRSMPEWDCCRFLGFLNRGQVLDLLQHTRIGCAALLDVGQYYHIENLPTKAYECMALGLPVILSNTPYCSRVVKEYGFGVCVDPEDIAGYAAAIKRLLDDPALCEEMGRKGRQAVKEVFNWDTEFQHLLELYRSL